MNSKDAKTDILIVGGGTGGVAAAWAACEMGKMVVMTEPTKWIGGQLTQQAVPPDENPAVEFYGGTLRYRQFREGVRQYYRDHYPLTEEARRNPYLNPGNGRVSALCHEFKVSLAVLESKLAPYLASGRLVIHYHTEPIAAETDDTKVKSVRFRQDPTGEEFTVEAPYIIDASELGDLLPLTGTEYVVGFESKAMTGEPSARDNYEPGNQQAISWCFAMEYREGESHVIPKPENYDFWRAEVPQLTPPWSGPWLDWQTCRPWDCEPVSNGLFTRRDGQHPTGLFGFRQIIDKRNFRPGFYQGNVTLVNWPQIDYILGPVIDVSAEEKARHFRGAQQQSLSMLYWMQTEAPRDDESGRAGYPELKLRGDLTGDALHGLALYPYIRESRRIKAEFTVLEQHVAKAIREDRGAELFHDSVGIGHYNIDLHPSTGLDNYIDRPCCPFQIPLGALIPQRMENLLPAAKNLGVTHLTNGCYRLHPVEWNIGEVAGILAAHCLDHQISPRQVRNTPAMLEDFQDLIRAHHIFTEWPRVYSERPAMR